MALETDTLKAELRNINPLTDNVIDAMIGAIENWLKSATISIPELSVKVDARTGLGATEATEITEAIS